MKIKCDLCGGTERTALFKGVFMCNQCREMEIERISRDVARMDMWLKDNPGSAAWAVRDRAVKQLRGLKENDTRR